MCNFERVRNRKVDDHVSSGSAAPQVFISHSSIDTWVAQQIAGHICSCGASTFLDESNIDYGDDFEDRIIAAAEKSNELLVLLTPWATSRPYIWVEIGLFLRDRKRIVGVIYGLTAKDVSTDERIPTLLKRLDLVEINKLDGYSIS
jgi:TIR domain